MGGFLGRLTAWAPRAGQGQRDRLALVLRVGNIAELGRGPAPVSVPGLLGQIAARACVQLRLDRAMQADEDGHLCAVLPDGHARRLPRQVARLRALCAGGLALPGGQPGPALGAVLVRGPAHVGAGALFDTGRRHLRRHGTGAEVAVIDWIAPAAPPRLVPRAAPPAPPQLEMRFQPQVCCHTGAVTGFEAMPRLRHPLRGLIEPADFLPLLTRPDREALTRTALSRSLAALRHWDGAGHGVATVSLDLSPDDLGQPRLAETILWELDRQELAPGRLVIEVQETIAPQGGGAALANLHRLIEAGCRVDLDGFGTGRASLDAIRRLRVNRVKIDRSFILGCDHDPDQQRMILAILALTEHLGLEALACGVDRAPERAFAAQIGCSQLQGVAVAPPLPLERTDPFLTRCRRQADQLPRLRRA